MKDIITNHFLKTLLVLLLTFFIAIGIGGFFPKFSELISYVFSIRTDDNNLFLIMGISFLMLTFSYANLDFKSITSCKEMLKVILVNVITCGIFRPIILLFIAHYILFNIVDSELYNFNHLEDIFIALSLLCVTPGAILCIVWTARTKTNVFYVVLQFFINLLLSFSICYIGAKYFFNDNLPSVFGVLDLFNIAKAGIEIALMYIVGSYLIAQKFSGIINNRLGAFFEIKPYEISDKDQKLLRTIKNGSYYLIYFLIGLFTLCQYHNISKAPIESLITALLVIAISTILFFISLLFCNLLKIKKSYTVPTVVLCSSSFLELVSIVAHQISFADDFVVTAMNVGYISQIATICLLLSLLKPNESNT